MLDLQESVRHQCPGAENKLLTRHFRSLPTIYFERYSASDIARHVRLLSGLTADNNVEVEFRPLAAQVFEVLVVGVDHSGTVACITAALAAYGFSLEDVQVSSYVELDDEPRYFVILLRVSGSLKGLGLGELSREMRDRLSVAFTHLAQGNLLEAQTVAADTRIAHGDSVHATPHRDVGHGRPVGHEGMVLGGDFRMQRKLATGGTSDIYLATQVSLNRTVAVKLFHHQGDADDELLARFNQEAVVLAQFSCPYIVQILAAGTVPDRATGILGWMAMEYMAGGDLAGWQRQHGCPPVELATQWLRGALEGLHYAHRRSVLHRDLKPHNLLLTGEGLVKVSDFGLLKQAQRLNVGLTPHSAILGTPHYMSPEQTLGEALDERSDIFSLGTTFFHLLSGRLPFQKNTATAVLVQISQEEAPKLADVAAHVPLPLSVLVSRMMARRREERYQDVGVILEDLASYERRGLLQVAEAAAFVPVQAVPAPVKVAETTQAYVMPPGEASGVAT